MEHASIGESSLKTSDTEKKSSKDSSKTTSVSRQLGAEAVIPVPVKDKDKTLGSLISLDSWRRPEKEAPLSLDKLDKEVPKLEPVTTPTELARPSETKLDKAPTELELLLPNPDEAWLRVDPNRRITWAEQPTPIKATPLEELPITTTPLEETDTPKLADEAEPVVEDQIELEPTSHELKAEVPLALVEDDETLLSADDNEIHDLPLHDLPLKDHDLLERPEPAELMAEIKPKATTELPTPKDDQPPEIFLNPERLEQLTAETEAITPPMAEAEAASGGDSEPPKPPEAAEAASEPEEPERRPIPAVDPVEALDEDEPPVPDETLRFPHAERLVAAPELPPMPTVIERHTVERRLGLPGVVSLFGLLGLSYQHRRMERDLRRIHRHEHEQKKRTEQFAAQQKRANEQLSDQLAEHQTESERRETKVINELKTLNKLRSKPKQLYERTVKPIKGRVKMPKSVERFKDRTARTIHSKRANLLPKPLLRRPSRSLERPITPVEPPRKAREVVLSPAKKYEAALKKAAIRLNSKPAKQPSLYELPTPTTEWLSPPAEIRRQPEPLLPVSEWLRPVVEQSRPRQEVARIVPRQPFVARRPETAFSFTTSTRPETAFKLETQTKPETAPEQQLKAVVAETAIDQVIQLPEGHHLEQSAWHSIEVDKSGKAVEQPVFSYGQEFAREQHQEAWQQANLSQPAAAPPPPVPPPIASSNAWGPLNYVTPDLVVPPVPVSPTNSPTIKFENTIREHSQFRLSSSDPYVLFLIVMVVIIMAITGLIVIH